MANATQKQKKAKGDKKKWTKKGKNSSAAPPTGNNLIQYLHNQYPAIQQTIDLSAFTAGLVGPTAPPTAAPPPFVHSVQPLFLKPRPPPAMVLIIED